MVNAHYSNKEKYKRQSVILTLSSLKCLPETSEYLLTEVPDEYNMSIFKTKNNGFILKAKKEISEKEFKKYLLNAIIKYCENNMEIVTSTMDDKYECDFDISLLTKDIIDDRFDISISKKYVYVDLDV